MPCRSPAPRSPAPLRVLTLSTLFPNAAQPYLGGFVQRQCEALARLPNTQIQVVAPLGLPPWPLSRIPRYRSLADLPPAENWVGLSVWRPSFRHWPASDGRWDAAAITRALIPLLTDIRRNFRFDVLDAQYFFPDGPAAIALARHFNVPVSIKARGADIHYWGRRRASARQIKAAADAADGLLAASAALKDDMSRLGLPDDQIAVHYTGVDMDVFKPSLRQQARAALGITAPLIVSLGALIPRKRQHLVIEALPHIPRAQLALVGDGPDKARLQAKARQLGVSARLICTGALPPPDIALWLAAADVMALPSASEGLANAWLEALACGTPIVITDVGGAREVLTDPRAGRFVEPTPDALARALQDILLSPPSPDICHALATRFTWAKNAQALRDHLSALTGERFADPLCT